METAREGIVLLKERRGYSPTQGKTKSILLTGDFVDKLAFGGGAAEVKGYDNKLMLDELKKEFGGRLLYVKNPTPAQISSAEIVLCNVGTEDSEGWDRPFPLPEDQELKCFNAWKIIPTPSSSSPPAAASR